MDTISKPLSFHTVEISKFNILIVRDKEGEINAFYNSCSHRGSILKKEKSGKLKSNLLICPYHQWSYNASNGNLVRTTSIIDPKNFRKDENCLTKVKIKAMFIESSIVGYKLKKGKIKICISKANINPDPTSIILSISCFIYTPQPPSGSQ